MRRQGSGVGIREKGIGKQKTAKEAKAGREVVEHEQTEVAEADGAFSVFSVTSLLMYRGTSCVHVPQRPSASSAVKICSTAEAAEDRGELYGNRNRNRG